MTIDKVHELIDMITRKEKVGFISIEEKDKALDLGQLDYYAECFEEYGRTQRLHEALEPFKEKFLFTNATSVAGLVTLPTDCMHILNAYSKVFDNTSGATYNKAITPIKEDELVAAIESQLRPISILKPIAEFGKGVMTLYPSVPMAGYVTYLKRPDAPVYGYSLSGRAVTYDSGASTQLQWSDLYVRKVVMKALSYLGIRLSDDKLIEYSSLKDKTTV